MIRRCTQQDKDVWVKLNEEFMDYEYSEESACNNPKECGSLEEDFENIINDPSQCTELFLIIEEGEAIGFMNVQSFFNVWSHGKVYFLDDFYITDRFRGKGYGEKALKELEKHGKEKGKIRIQLLAEYSNPGAIKFYKNNNYREQSVKYFLNYL